MLKTIFVIAAVAIAGLLIYAATRPDSFAVSRSATIKAPPEAIFPHINDFRRWEAWSPYEKKDPAMTRSFSGPASGKGAIYDFSGNSSVGAGRVEIADASPPSKVMINLNMLKPMKANNRVEFTLQPQGDSTKVTWAMNGESSYLGKVMCLFFNMDSMVGGDFEAGLANLKALAER